jgi:hypothetical protein
MSELPKIVCARLQAQPAEVHPDEDVLTAFYEQALPENEREPVLAHLAECSECRDVIGMALPVIEETRVRAVVPASAWAWPQMVRWGSLVACLVVVGAAVLMHHPGTSVVVRPASEADVMDQRDDAAAAAKDKAASTPELAPAQNLRSETEQKAPVALSEKTVPAQPKRLEPSLMGAEKAAGDQASKPTLDHPATAFATRGAFERAPQTATALARALPAPAPPAMKSESVEVAAEQAAVTVAPTAPANDLKQADTPGRAKAGAVVSANEAVAPEPSGAMLAQSFAKETQSTPAGVPPNLTKMPAEFELSPEGQLQRSFDSGKTWEAVPLVDRVKFNALAVMGPEVWVGGAAGVLYHSADNGRQWKLMKPSVAGVALTADIMNVRFTDMQHLAVMTSDGQVWTTVDGGQNWQRNR